MGDLAGAGMSLIVCFPQSFFCHMGVNLGRRERGVAQKCLDASEVSTCVKQVSGKGVTEFMRRNIEGNIGISEVFFQQAIDRARRESLPQLGDEEGPLGHLGSMPICLNGSHGVRSNRDEPLFRAFSHDSQGV